MATVLRISDAASLALHTMVILAADPEKLITAKSVAKDLNVSEAHLSKVLQRLSKHRLVWSTRGPGGGFRLARKPGRITLLEVYEAIDGPLVEDQCLLGFRVCGRKTCIMGDVIQSVNRTIRQYLSSTRLADLIE